jgi:Ca2+-binding EF-hand superfamily protein
MSPPKVAELFKKFDVDNNGVLDFNEFVGFMDILLKR